MNKEVIDKLFATDGGPHGLSFVVSARSGSGKTVLLSRLVEAAVRVDSMSNTRFIYVTLKSEVPFDDSKHTASAFTVGEVAKALDKNRIIVFNPSEPDEYTQEIDSLLDMVCKVSEANDDARFVVIVDDCNIIDGFDNRGNPTSAVKKTILAGRSMGVKLGMVTHRLGNLPRIINGNASSMLVLDISEMDIDYAEKVFGMRFGEILEGLGEYRWAFVDLIEQTVEKFRPVTL